MRMRIAAAHHQSTVLENLDIVDAGTSTQTLELLYPNVDQPANLRHRHLRKCQMLPRREAHNPADAAFNLCNKQAFSVYIHLRRRCLGLQCAEIIIEYKRVGI